MLRPELQKIVDEYKLKGIPIFLKSGKDIGNALQLSAVEPETCGCKQPLFTHTDGTKGCPSCGEQY